MIKKNDISSFSAHGMNPQNCSKTSGRETLLNLTNLHITIKKWISENEYGKRRYYNECRDVDLDLIITDTNFDSESKTDSRNVFAPHEMISELYMKFFIA